MSSLLSLASPHVILIEYGALCSAMSSLFSLASLHVILVEYGALTLALHTINKYPGWVPDGGSSDEFTKEFQEY